MKFSVLVKLLRNLLKIINDLKGFKFNSRLYYILLKISLELIKKLSELFIFITEAIKSWPFLKGSWPSLNPQYHKIYSLNASQNMLQKYSFHPPPDIEIFLYLKFIRRKKISICMTLIFLHESNKWIQNPRGRFLPYRSRIKFFIVLP